MSVKIRLKRIGRKKRPFYRIVVTDSRTRRDGREIEKIGWFDPVVGKDKVQLDEDRVIYWIEQGAIPSPTMSNILKRLGVNYKLHLLKLGKTEEEIKLELEKWKTDKENKAETVSKQPNLVIDVVEEETMEVEDSNDVADDNSESEVESEESTEENSEAEPVTK